MNRNGFILKGEAMFSEIFVGNGSFVEQAQIVHREGGVVVCVHAGKKDEKAGHDVASILLSHIAANGSSPSPHAHEAKLIKLVVNEEQDR